MRSHSPIVPATVPFDFRPRTNVIFGQGSLERLSVLARELGFTRTLLVADPGLMAAGHVEPAATLLRGGGIDVIRFSDFDANPDTDMIEAGRRFASAQRIDSNVALGGGARWTARRASTLSSLKAARSPTTRATARRRSRCRR